MGHLREHIQTTMLYLLTFSHEIKIIVFWWTFNHVLSVFHRFKPWDLQSTRWSSPQLLLSVYLFVRSLLIVLALQMHLENLSFNLRGWLKIEGRNKRPSRASSGERNPASVDVCGFQTTGSYWPQTIRNQALKVAVWFMIMLWDIMNLSQWKNSDIQLCSRSYLALLWYLWIELEVCWRKVVVRSKRQKYAYMFLCCYRHIIPA